MLITLERQVECQLFWYFPSIYERQPNGSRHINDYRTFYLQAMREYRGERQYHILARIKRLGDRLRNADRYAIEVVHRNDYALRALTPEHLQFEAFSCTLTEAKNMLMRWAAYRIEELASNSLGWHNWAYVSTRRAHYPPEHLEAVYADNA